MSPQVHAGVYRKSPVLAPKVVYGDLSSVSEGLKRVGGLA